MSTPSHALEVEVHNAGKSFGAFRALDNVSIKVRPGTVHALLGENYFQKSPALGAIIDRFVNRKARAALPLETRQLS